MPKFNNFWLTLAVGLVLPLAFGLIFFSVVYRGEMQLFSALKIYIDNTPTLISKLILVACVPNLFGVFLSYHFQWWRACRGLMAAVLAYFAVAMIFI